jgi:hypothetical protein
MNHILFFFKCSPSNDESSMNRYGYFMVWWCMKKQNRTDRVFAWHISWCREKGGGDANAWFESNCKMRKKKYLFIS